MLAERHLSRFLCTSGDDEKGRFRSNLLPETVSAKRNVINGCIRYISRVLSLKRRTRIVAACNLQLRNYLGIAVQLQNCLNWEIYYLSRKQVSHWIYAVQFALYQHIKCCLFLATKATSPGRKRTLHLLNNCDNLRHHT